MLVTCALSRWELRGWFAGARTCVLVYMARRCCQPTRATVSNFPRLHCHCIIYFPNIIRFMFHHFMSKTSVIKRISYNGCISLPRSTAIDYRTVSVMIYVRGVRRKEQGWTWAAKKKHMVSFLTPSIWAHGGWCCWVGCQTSPCSSLPLPSPPFHLPKPRNVLEFKPLIYSLSVSRAFHNDITRTG